MLPAPSTLSLQYRVHGSFYRGQKIRFFMFSVCLELWELPQLMPPPPLALCFSVVSVWFEFGAEFFFFIRKLFPAGLFYRTGKIHFFIYSENSFFYIRKVFPRDPFL